MSERKVLNKYYPPDFDPSKIPRFKGLKNRQFTVRLMAPCNMRCKQCGEYIYKGKKFNARKEDVENDEYLGIRIFRFYIKCTRCLQEISFKTDPKNTDYIIEAGATRNFMALKLAEEQAEREEEEKRQEEASNPMKLLENRTSQSKQELEILESLEELKDMNKRQQTIDYNSILQTYSTKEAKERLEKLQEEEDEKYIKSVFGTKKVIKEEIVDINDEPKKKKKKKSKHNQVEEVPPEAPAPPKEPEKPVQAEVKPVKKIDGSWNTSIGSISKSKTALSNLVKVKQPPSASSAAQPSSSGSSGAAQPSQSSAPANGTAPKPTSALSMLGSYSDSESGSDA